MLRNSGGMNGLLLVAVMLCALSVVTSQNKARKLFNELQKEKEHALQMNVEWGQLQLEQSTWSTPARVEKIATRQLQMQLPRAGQIRSVHVANGGEVTATSSPSSASLPPLVNRESAEGKGGAGKGPASLGEMGNERISGAKRQP